MVEIHLGANATDTESSLYADFSSLYHPYLLESSPQPPKFRHPLQAHRFFLPSAGAIFSIKPAPTFALSSHPCCLFQK